MVVAVHFVPMAFLTEDLAYLLLGVVETAALVLAYPRLRKHTGTTSALGGLSDRVTIYGLGRRLNNRSFGINRRTEILKGIQEQVTEDGIAL